MSEPMAENRRNYNIPGIVIATLLGALLTLAGMGFSDMKGDIEKLDQTKANKDVIEAQLDSIHSVLADIKSALDKR